MSGITFNFNAYVTFKKKKRILIESILQINTRSIQDMHIYADPSCIPVVRIEKHVMIVPRHCSSEDFLTDTSEPGDTFLPPLLRGLSLEKNTSGCKSGYVLRAVIFVHGFQVRFLLRTGNSCFSLITSATYLAETFADP